MFQKIKVLFYLLFYGLSVQSQNNTLVIFSASGTPFFLSVNHNSINKIADANIKVFDLITGWNLIEIKIPEGDKEIKFKDSILLSNKSKFFNKEFTYVLLEKEGELQLQFNSVSEPSGPQVPAIPAKPKEVIPLVDNSIYGNLYKAVKNKPVFYTNYDNETSTCKITLTDKEIKYAINLLNKANDKEAAYRYLTQIIDLNCYTTIQLKELLETVTIDMDRLNSAKKAYSHILDQQNINTLLPLFKYPVMKESYTSFLREQENIIKQKSLQCKEPISDAKFEVLFSKIKSKDYENEKIIVSKKLLVDVCLSSIQIKKISELFAHEREKLEFMKCAFNVLTDKENAKTLAEEFQYNETKDEFLKYISQ
jgi:hypothetical protein